MQLYQEGYDVWIAGIRGTEYSRRHKVYDADFDPQFWNFENSDIAENDVHAMVKKIFKESETCRKITLMGHSMGSMQILNLLSKSTRARKYISHVIGMEPCMVTDQAHILASEYHFFETGARAIGMNSWFGPTYTFKVD